jgi:NitT/TauT family transport system substrate-binding protein
MTTAWVDGHKDDAQNLANAYVKTLKWISIHSGAEITDKMPADYYKGIGKAAYAKALDDGKAMFTAQPAALSRRTASRSIVDG